MTRREFLKLTLLLGVLGFLPFPFRLKSLPSKRELGKYKPKGRILKFYPPFAEVTSHLNTAKGVSPKNSLPTLRV